MNDISEHVMQSLTYPHEPTACPSPEHVRLLREAAQMLDLEPYRPVSDLPAVRRDLSVAVGAEEDAETLGDRVRESLGDEATLLEAVDRLRQRAPVPA